MIFKKKHRNLKFLWNIFLDQLNQPLQLSQNNVTLHALASVGLSACDITIILLSFPFEMLRRGLKVVLTRWLL